MTPEEVQLFQGWHGPYDETYFRELERVRARPVPPSEVGGQPEPAPHLGWEPAVQLRRATVPPPFPIDAFPDWIATWVTAEAESLQVPLELAGGLVVGVLSTVAGGRAVVVPQADWWEPLNTFWVLAMEPGSRKSAAIREATVPLVEHERSLLESSRTPLAEQASARRIAEHVLRRSEQAAANAQDADTRLAAEADARTAAAALERHAVPRPPRLLAADVTPEQLATLLFEQSGRMAVVSAEPGIFGVMAGRYAQGSMPNLDVYLAGHAGDALRVDRKGRSPEVIERPALTIVVMAQPHVLRQAFRVADLRGRGLLDRFSFLLPPPNVGYRKTDTRPVPAAVRQRYVSSVRALAVRLDELETPLTMTLSDEALEGLTDWRAKLEPRRRPDGDLGGALQGWASKADGLTVRVAGLLHLAGQLEADLATPIAAPTIAAAVEIVECLIVHAQSAYAVMGADPQVDAAERVLDWIRDRGLATVTQRQVHAAHQSRFARAEEVAGVLHLLDAHGFLRLLPTVIGEKGGRPSTRYGVHPGLQNGTEGTEPTTGRGSVNSVGSVSGPDGRS